MACVSEPEAQSDTAEIEKQRALVSAQLSEQALDALRALLTGIQVAGEVAGDDRFLRLAQEQPEHVCEGLITAILRLLFLCCAEEQGLMPHGETDEEHVSVLGLYEQLRADTSLSPEMMHLRHSAWPRLLSLFRRVHNSGQQNGTTFPALHDQLFDPTTYPFLDGCLTAHIPLASDSCVYTVLRGLLVLGGRALDKGGERLSYRALGVEQLGVVYEAMMGFDIECARHPSMTLRPREVVTDLQALLEIEPGGRKKWLLHTAECKLSAAEARAVQAAASVEALAAALHRKRSLRSPQQLAPGSLFLQPGIERRRSGSHYTPRSVTTTLARATLSPLVTRLGPHPTPEQLLSLKVCDPAMGSGAFLLEACRQLADELVTSWQHHGTLPMMPVDEARRLVAQRCLYGVDKNPIAVQLARLSLWLLARSSTLSLRFLDHVLCEGDALIGLSREQVASFSWTRPRQCDARCSAARSDSEELQRADLCIAAFFGADSARTREQKRRIYQALAPAEARSVVADLRGGDDPITPFHWEVVFPEVFSRPDPGFDAVIGNPPFLNAIESATGRSSVLSDYFKVAYPVFAKGAYDYCLLFWARLEHLLRASGRYGMLSPTVLLSSMKVWQPWMHQNLRPDTFLLLPVDQFEAARIRTVGIAGGRGAASSYRVENWDDTRPEASFSRPWNPFVSNWYEGTRSDTVRLDNSPLKMVSLSEAAIISAGCATGAAYELKPLVLDDPDVGGPKLITTGTIDRYVSKWGAMTIRYLKSDYHHPRWPDEEDIPTTVARARNAQKAPKILVGGLTAVLEAWLDESGDSAGIVQTWVVTPKPLASAYALLGLLNSATFTRVFMQKFGAGAMSGAQTTIKKASLLQSPVPQIQDAHLDTDIWPLLESTALDELPASVAVAALARAAAALQAVPNSLNARRIDYLGHLLAGRLFGRTQAEADEDYRYWSERDRVLHPFTGTFQSIVTDPSIQAVLRAAPATFTASV